MLGLEGQLMVAILKVEHAPDFAVTLFFGECPRYEGVDEHRPPNCRLPFESHRPGDSRWVFTWVLGMRDFSMDSPHVQFCNRQ